MLMRFDPFREFDRMSQQLWREGVRPGAPMDAYRRGDEFIVHFDLPGVDPSSIDLTVEKNVLTVTATRQPWFSDSDQVLLAERAHGEFRRQLFLGEQLDTDHIEATYDNGVLTLTLSVAEQAKPRKVEIATGKSEQKELAGSTS
jgi:HSP20 family protein